MHLCPVCGFDRLAEPPYNAEGGGSFEICPCCGFEYGFDDHGEGRTHAAHRADWLERGAPWFDPDARPEGWDLQRQLEGVDRAVAALSPAYRERL